MIDGCPFSCCGWWMEGGIGCEPPKPRYSQLAKDTPATMTTTVTARNQKNPPHSPRCCRPMLPSRRYPTNDAQISTHLASSVWIGPRDLEIPVGSRKERYKVFLCICLGPSNITRMASILPVGWETHGVKDLLLCINGRLH